MHVATHSTSNRGALRASVVVALSLGVIAWFACDFHTIGWLGYLTDGDGVITAVDDNMPAAKAGMQLGDRVDVSATLPQFSWSVVTLTAVWSPGETGNLVLVRAGKRRTISMTAVAFDRSTVRKALHILNFAAAVLIIFLGAVLVLLRPSPITWGFFFYCLLLNPGNWTPGELPFSFPWPFMMSALYNLIFSAGSVGFIIFALRFLRDPISGWRQSAQRLMPALFVVLMVLGTWDVYQIAWVGGAPGETLNRAFNIYAPALLLLVALYAFIDTYVRSRGVDRQRMRWVIVGYGASQAGWVYTNFLIFYLPRAPNWILETAFISSVLFPLAVAYAVIKHRVIDVRFVISRAIVLGILTSLVVIVFALIDWIFVRKLEQTGLGIIAGLLTVTALGFTAQALHHRIDTFVDRALFKRRYLAEKRLAELASELPDVESPQALSELLVKEPLNAFQLTSAALFRQAEANEFERDDAIGWPAQDLRKLSAEVPPLSLVAGLRETKRIGWTDPTSSIFPSHDGEPVLAMPIVSRQKLMAVAFYGPHADGADFDPDEIHAINALLVPAAAAYYHLEAETLRRENERIRLEMEHLVAANQTSDADTGADEAPIDPPTSS